MPVGLHQINGFFCELIFNYEGERKIQKMRDRFINIRERGGGPKQPTRAREKKNVRTPLSDMNNIMPESIDDLET